MEQALAPRPRRVTASMGEAAAAAFAAAAFASAVVFAAFVSPAAGEGEHLGGAPVQDSRWPPPATGRVLAPRALLKRKKKMWSQRNKHSFESFVIRCQISRNKLVRM